MTLTIVSMIRKERIYIWRWLNTHNLEDAEAFKKEVEAEFPGMEIVLNPLSLSVSCHIGPGALAVACSKKIPELLE